jgi:hypothetical protein
VPLVILKEIELASDNAPGETVMAVPPLLDTFTTGVPVIVKAVMVAVVQVVPVPITVILPVPNAIVLAVELLLLNPPVIRVLSFKFNVPAERVTVLDAPNVRASWSAQDPVPLNVNELFIVTPEDVIVCAPVPLRVIKPDADHTVLEEIENDPRILIVPLLVRVVAPPEIVKFKQFRAPVNVTDCV